MFAVRRRVSETDVRGDTIPYSDGDGANAAVRLRRLHSSVLVAVVVALLAAGMLQVAGWARIAALGELREAANAALLLQAAALRSELERHRSVPLALARDPDIAELLRHPRDNAKVDLVNRRLAELCGAVGTAVLYVMDHDGLTLAASNWESDASFVGHNFSFRPYFQKALLNGSGNSFALGSVSQQAGFYVAQAVQKTLAGGVVVAKIQFEELEAEWRRSPVHVFVTDENSVVVLADQRSWQLRTVDQLAASQADALRKSLQFGDTALKPLPFVVPVSDGRVELVELADHAESGSIGTHLHVATPIAGTSWVMHTLTPIEPLVAQKIASATLIAGLLALGLLTFTFLAWYRRIQVRSRALEQVRVREALEVRVRDRTRELTESNDRLSNEIEERERVESVLRQAQEKLVHAEKLAALGQLAAGISHEVNQPLSAIRSYADNAIVLHERGCMQDVRQNLSSIASLTERIAQIMQHLRVFARKASGTLGPVSVKAAVAGSLALMAHRLRRAKIKASQNFPEEELVVWGEQIRLEQVLINLIQNAADAMAKSSPAKLCISARRVEGTVYLSVEDNGSGIAPECFPNLFSAFFTTKDGNGDLGLGLYISRGILEEFGGRISARSKPEGGSIFELTLPVADAPYTRDTRPSVSDIVNEIAT
jgi:two-component system C4-dicarboxylate transport sensor histidine kinase DctB